MMTEEVSISHLDLEVGHGLESLSDSNTFGEQLNSSPTLISSKIGKRAYRTAHRVQSEMLRHSKVVDSKKVEDIVRLECDEVLLGDLLGNGTFCHVTQVHRVDFKPTEDEVSPRVICQREDMHTKSAKDKYAIKFLRNDLNPEKYCLGAAELVVEMHLLSSLNHPNIINLHAVSSEGPMGFQNGNVYFFLIDRLYTTLDQSLATWKQREHRQKPDAATKMSLLLQRLLVAADIGSALAYLHSKKIVYRAIDPTNLAFNDSGRIVLFDLGLARELDEAKLTADGINYELTGNKGNVLYMAPEVGTCQPYGMRADVYGMAVLLWQICTLAPSPFPGLTTREQYIERVVQNQERPKLNPSWPETLQYLIQGSWAHDSSGRPPMKQFHRNLQHEIQDIQEAMAQKASKKPPHQRNPKEEPAYSPTSRYDPGMHLLLSLVSPSSPTSPNLPSRVPSRYPRPQHDAIVVQGLGRASSQSLLEARQKIKRKSSASRKMRGSTSKHPENQNMSVDTLRLVDHILEPSMDHQKPKRKLRMRSAASQAMDTPKLIRRPSVSSNSLSEGHTITIQGQILRREDMLGTVLSTAGSAATPIKGHTKPILREPKDTKWNTTLLPSEKISADKTTEENNKTSLRQQSLMRTCSEGRFRLFHASRIVQRLRNKSKSRQSENNASTRSSALLRNRKSTSKNNVVWKEQLIDGKTRKWQGPAAA